MGLDLELLAAGDATILLDAATEELNQEDDAMAGVWDDLDGQDGGWWELTLKEETLLQETLRGHAGLGPVAMDVKLKQAHDKQEKNAVDSGLVGPKRQVQVSDDSQTESSSDGSATKPVLTSIVTRARAAKKNAALPVVKLEPVQRITKKQGKSKLKVQRKRKPSASKSTSVSPKKEVVKEEKHLTPLEIRRKRNRESMQRARRRQRDDVERMKGTLQQLEKHYQELNEQSQARRQRVSSHDDTVGESLTLEADYYALADLSHTLKEEKFLLEQMLMEKQKTHRRLQQVMVDRKQELDLACPLTTDDASLYSDYEYLPMTEDQANEHVRLCYQRMRQVEESGKPIVSRYEVPDDDDVVNGSPCSPTSTSSSSCPNAGEGCPFPPSATFGWDVRYETSAAGDFYVSFTKFFAGITPQEAMVGSWTRYHKPASTPFRRQLRFEVLQVINDSTYITGQDIEHPVEHDKVMRMIFLNFRMQTEKGFVIGRHSVNPTSPEVRMMAEKNSHFEYVDSSNWVEFVAAEDEKTGESGCRVKFIARTEYNTQEDMYVRLVNSISRTMIWELAVVPSSSLSLLP